MPKFNGNIPKYILKRILPPNGLCLEGNELKMEVKNILRPIMTKNFPDNAKDFITISIDDEVITTQGNNDLMDEVKILFKGETMPFNEISKIEQIGVGDSVFFIIPNVKNLQKGKKYKLTITIKNEPNLNTPRKKNKPRKEKSPMKFEIEREVM